MTALWIDAFIDTWLESGFGINLSINPIVNQPAIRDNALSMAGRPTQFEMIFAKIEDRVDDPVKARFELLKTVFRHPALNGDKRIADRGKPMKDDQEPHFEWRVGTMSLCIGLLTWAKWQAESNEIRGESPPLFQGTPASTLQKALTSNSQWLWDIFGTAQRDDKLLLFTVLKEQHTSSAARYRLITEVNDGGRSETPSMVQIVVKITSDGIPEHAKPTDSHVEIQKILRNIEEQFTNSGKPINSKSQIQHSHGESSTTSPPVTPQNQTSLISGDPRESHPGVHPGPVLLIKAMGVVRFSPAAEMTAHFLREEINSLISAGTVYWNDFWGEEVTLLLADHKASRRARIMKAVLLAIAIQHRAIVFSKAKKLKNEIRLGAVIHWERADQQSNTADLRTAASLEGVNLARRLIWLTNRPHVLLSSEAHQLLGLQHDLDRLKQIEPPTGFEDLRELLTDIPIEDFRMEQIVRYDIMKELHVVYSLSIRMLDRYLGDPIPPQQLVALRHRPVDRHPSRNNPFVRILIESDEIVILGVTLENLLTWLDYAHDARIADGRGCWKLLQIVFPSQEVVRLTHDQHEEQEKRLAAWRGSRREVFGYFLHLQSQYASTTQTLSTVGKNTSTRDMIPVLECYEFNGLLPFVGQRYRGDQSGAIRISPILPGGDVKDGFYVEVFEGSQEYKQLDLAFDFILAHSAPLIELHPFGRFDDKTFELWGLVSRKHHDHIVKRFSRNSNKPSFPIVLVMLHARTLGRHEAILQHRTRYNSSSDHQKYSNLSGWLVDTDLLIACGISLSSQVCQQYMRAHHRVDVGDTNLDLLTEDFHSTTKRLYHQPNVTPQTVFDAAWLQAAEREINDELGLHIDPARLIQHEAACVLDRGDRHLTFRIFSLEISINDLAKVESARPHATLQRFDLAAIRELHAKRELNNLFQAKFEDVFIPIYQKLGVQ